jgi:hypothetical protein
MKKRPRKTADTNQAAAKPPIEWSPSDASDAADKESRRNAGTTATRWPGKGDAAAGRDAGFDGPGIPPGVEMPDPRGTGDDVEGISLRIP